jgi:SNF2 family DNA or RNA helicase
MEAFPNIAVKVDGSVPVPKRQGFVDQFQNDEKIRLFIGSSAADKGYTLTKANHLIHLEFEWTPGGMDQKTDRVHRIGQLKQVIIYYLFAKFTIEEKIAKILDGKRYVLDAVLDGKETEQGNLLSEIMNSYL